uniref:FAD-binding PCMH-type domain-containing protein n=1 Tax=Ditylenchus dipsaci TaxID=166011 RepID=A0A915CY42_9BILA
MIKNKFLCTFFIFPSLTKFVSSIQVSSNHLPLTNWAGNVHFSTANIFYPSTVQDVQQIVAQHRKVKVVGDRHSFNRNGDSHEGITYGKLGEYLHHNGFALHNLASLPQITVAGAISTGAHGSGTRNGNLASIVTALEVVLANGTLIHMDERDPRLNASIVSVGCIGVITKVTLRVQPTYMVRQDIFVNLSITEVIANFQKIMLQGYSVSLWLDKFINEVWLKTRLNVQNKIKQEPVYKRCSDHTGAPGPWCERLLHVVNDKEVEFGKGNLQTEYFLPIEHGAEAVKALYDLEWPRFKQNGLFLSSEIRSVAADELWLSPAYKKDCAVFHFTWSLDEKALLEVLPEVEQALAPFGAIPHWAKIFTMGPEVLAKRHKKLAEFKNLVLKQFDPTEKFMNTFSKSVFNL